ncbi:hypothetical protein ACNKHN_08695 [Shigella flexneri]
MLLDIFTPDACLALLSRQRCACYAGQRHLSINLLNLLEKQPADLQRCASFFAEVPQSQKSGARNASSAGIKLSVYGSTESFAACGGESRRSFAALCTPTVTLPQVSRLKSSMTHARLTAKVEGEEASRRPNVFMGYFDEPELTTDALDEEGWYYSGVSPQDEAGYIK